MLRVTQEDQYHLQYHMCLLNMTLQPGDGYDYFGHKLAGVLTTQCKTVDCHIPSALMAVVGRFCLYAKHQISHYDTSTFHKTERTQYVTEIQRYY